MIKVLKYLAIILIANISFLFSPPPSDLALGNGMHTYIRFHQYMGATINVDSHVFIADAINPSGVLQQNSTRQSRPLYIIAGTTLGNAIYYCTYPFHQAIGNYLKRNNLFQARYSDRQEDDSVKFFLFYIGYILFNAIILLASFILFEKIVIAFSGKWKNGSVLWAMTLLLLASNQQTKFFFWTPHQQLFGILVPLLCIYLGVLFLQTRIGYRKLLFISAALGVLVLVYGSFLLTLPVIIAGYLHAEKKRTGIFRMSQFISILLAGFIFFMPMLCWIFYLRYIGITFFSYEVDLYREFIWILDYSKTSFYSFGRKVLSNSLHFLQTFGCLIVPLALLSIAFLVRKQYSGSARISMKKDFLLPGGSLLLLFVFVETIIFFWLMGYYGDRLTFSLVTPIFCIFAILINLQKLDDRTKYLLIVVIVVFHLYNVFSTPLRFVDRLLYS